MKCLFVEIRRNTIVKTIVLKGLITRKLNISSILNVLKLVVKRGNDRLTATNDTNIVKDVLDESCEMQSG